MSWKPGSRAERASMELPYEDVPPHLRVPLWNWLSKALDDSELIFYMGLQLRLPIVDPRSGIHARLEAVNDLAAIIDRDESVLLDCIEWVLETGSKLHRHDWDKSVSQLNVILHAGHSAYRLKSDGAGLEMRITPQVRDQVTAVIDSAQSSAGGHLTASWNAAYGRHPDPVRSYSESIKAVESAAAPVVSPANPKATLGTLIRDLRAKPSKWSFAIPAPDDSGISQVQQLMSLLWEGQTSRHGGNSPTVPETLDSARAAVHIAATLVQFFTGASVTRARD